MENKFILKITPNPDSFQSISLNRDTYDKIMELKAKTGLKAYQIVSSMVDYCLERLEIQE